MFRCNRHADQLRSRHSQESRQCAVRGDAGLQIDSWHSERPRDADEVSRLRKRRSDEALAIEQRLLLTDESQGGVVENGRKNA